MTPLHALVTEYLAHLRIERGLAANTLQAYARDLARYEAHLVERGITDLALAAEADVTAFVRAVRTGADGGRPLASSSAGRLVACVRGLHRFALREGRVSEDVAAGVSPPAAPRPLPHALDHAQVAALLGSVPAGPEPVPLRDRALLELLYGTGTRISEAVNLAVDDVDLDGRSVTVLGKGSKVRVLPLGRFATEALESWMVRGRPVLAARGRGTPQVFLNTLGRPLSRQSAWAILQQAAARAGIDHVSPHTLRHTFATHLLQGGADVRVVQELLGHASVTTTQIYTHVTIDALRESWAMSHPRAR
ncbi:MAG: site-specific tyrosine recombinase XerD [Actinomycetota bacterium]